MSPSGPNLRFNPPSNWPVPPRGWEPPPGWAPDPGWGPAPHGWPLWVKDRNWFMRHKVLSALGSCFALFLLLCAIGGLAGGEGGSSTPKTDAVAETAPSAQATPAGNVAEKAAADKAAADRAATEKKAAAEKVAKEKAAKVKAAKEKAAKRRVAMPHLVGLKLNIAMDVASNVGLTNVTVCRTPGGDMPLWFSNWRIIGQDIPAGKKIKVGTEVCLDAMKDSDM